MTNNQDSDLYKRMTRLRWQVPLLALLLVLIHQLVEHTLLMQLPRWQHFATQVLFYGVIGPFLAWWALTSLRRSIREASLATNAQIKSHQAMEEANKQLSFLINLNHRLAEAEDEETLIEMILEVPFEVVSATGCSLIRFDASGHPLQAIHRGSLDPIAFQALSSHLSTQEIRERCACCVSHVGSKPTDCPILDISSNIIHVEKVFCLPITYGGRDYGVLNIYLPDAVHPNAEEEALLRTSGNEISLALESLRLRSRELEALYRLQQVRRLSDMHADLELILKDTVSALEVDGGVLFLAVAGEIELQAVAEVGNISDEARIFIQGLANGARQAEKPLVVSDLAIEESGEQIRSLLIAPLRSDDQSSGALVLLGKRPDVFSRRHIRLLATVAGQAALLVENYRLYLRVEHEAGLAERARLAREIHDGLAQTLGYLKLRSTQLMNWIGKEQDVIIEEGLQDMVELLGEAYDEARQAIDGLRLQTQSWEIPRWLGQIMTEFSEISTIRVDAQTPPNIDFPPEIQAQLLRIIQEALGNVRKHSEASFVRVRWPINDTWVTLSIQDDGKGFNPEAVPVISRHGLHTMRERADLIGADFQIQSRIGSGTEVTVRIPLQEIHQDWPLE